MGRRVSKKRFNRKSYKKNARLRKKSNLRKTSKIKTLRKRRKIKTKRGGSNTHPCYTTYDGELSTLYKKGLYKPDKIVVPSDLADYYNSGSKTGHNRYFDIKPNPLTRISFNSDYASVTYLQTQNYINANKIDYPSLNTCYIASQGPLPQTIDQFWRMIYQENVKIIVMVTGLVEKGRQKCERYWPETVGTKTAFPAGGEFLVTNTGETRGVEGGGAEDYLITNLEITRTGSPNIGMRKVTHYWYDKWPDHGVPTTECGTMKIDGITHMLNTINQTESNQSTLANPWVVHCSAGVGRTGTIIAADIARKLKEANKTIDIVEIVSTMRKCRMMLVQHEDQFKLLYQYVKSLCEETIKWDTSDQLTFDEWNLIKNTDNFLNNTYIVRKSSIVGDLTFSYKDQNGQIINLKITENPFQLMSTSGPFSNAHQSIDAMLSSIKGGLPMKKDSEALAALAALAAEDAEKAAEEAKKDAAATAAAQALKIAEAALAEENEKAEAAKHVEVLKQELETPLNPEEQSCPIDSCTPKFKLQAINTSKTPMVLGERTSICGHYKIIKTGTEKPISFFEYYKELYFDAKTAKQISFQNKTLTELHLLANKIGETNPEMVAFSVESSQGNPKIYINGKDLNKVYVTLDSTDPKTDRPNITSFRSLYDLNIFNWTIPPALFFSDFIKCKKALKEKYGGEGHLVWALWLSKCHEKQETKPKGLFGTLKKKKTCDVFVNSLKLVYLCEGVNILNLGDVDDDEDTFDYVSGHENSLLKRGMIELDDNFTGQTSNTPSIQFKSDSRSVIGSAPWQGGIDELKQTKGTIGEKLIKYLTRICEPAKGDIYGNLENFETMSGHWEINPKEAFNNPSPYNIEFVAKPLR
jgi:protein tyrosine phosphatase